VRFLNDAKPWATIMMVVLVGIAAIAGAVVVIFNGDKLSFQQYLDTLKNFAIAVGIIGIGRGIASAGKQVKTAALMRDDSLVPTEQPPAPAAGTTDGAVAPMYAAPGYDAGIDPYADVAWVEAPPPPQPQPQPAIVGEHPTPEV
jgi:hypothetical protein